MIGLTPGRPSDSPFKILCLGAHSDDLEIGCGGTVLKLQEAYRHTDFYWVVLGASGPRVEEARKSALQILENAAHTNIVIKDFKNSYFPYAGAELKNFFEEVKRDFSPDLILTHYKSDLHQDHRTVSELTWNAFRNHYILEYEIPKYDGDFGSPNTFVHLDEAIVQKKLDLILNNFQSQQGRQWFDRETFMSVLRIRGMESNSPTRYAEGFYCRKMLLA